MKEILNNPIVLLSVAIVIGQYFARIHYKDIKLGSSGTLFASLIFSFMVTKYTGLDIEIPKLIFTLSLIGFISSVGLTASASIKDIIKEHGIKFILLGLGITAVGAITTFGFIMLFANLDSSILGTYVGALTSSPGLATALELSSQQLVDISAQIGLGYSIAYIPGVLAVVFFTHALKPKKMVVKEASAESNDKVSDVPKKFDLKNYSLVLILGIALGSIKIALSKTMVFSLGITGGVLVSALLLGSIERNGKRPISFNDDHLDVIQGISLNVFLAIVGLNYGYDAINNIMQSGSTLLMVGVVTGTMSIIIGHLIGKYLLGIDGSLLAGAICGGMTSTPGLAVAVELYKDNKVVAGYGATYPFALLFIIVFTNILFSGGM